MAGHPTIDFIDTYSAAYRRDILLDAGGFEATMLIDEDQELSFRLESRGYRLVFEPAAIVYHQHVETVLKYFRRKFKIGFWKVAVRLRHRAKTFSDSHTPQSLKAQVVLLGLALVAAGCSGISREFLAVSGLLLVLFAISAMPLLWVTGRRDPAVLWIAPLMILCRALALGMGLIAGAVHFLIVPGTKSSNGINA
jgi:cellulose synthase/poly-beta-1,6-N-acetylglucosamine synthase-like glycosyltransferase